MWPSMSNPLVNPITPRKAILGITQIGIVTDHEDDEYSERKHNPRMPQINPTKKLNHEQRCQPSSIGDVGGFPTSRWIVPMSNDGGEPFSSGSNRPPRGDGCDPTRGGSSSTVKGCGSGP